MNIKNREKFEKLDNKIWKRTKIDRQGRVTLPKKLRRKLRLEKNSELLWISIKKRKRYDNEFIINVGVKNEEM